MLNSIISYPYNKLISFISLTWLLVFVSGCESTYSSKSTKDHEAQKKPGLKRSVSKEERTCADRRESFNSTKTAQLLSIIHLSDQEAAMDALFDIPRTSHVMNGLKLETPMAMVLSSGDHYLSGPFFSASENVMMQKWVGQSASSARADIIIQNLLGIKAASLGNHEFDKGPSLIASLLTPTEDYVGVSFPYLSSNLGFDKSVLAPFYHDDLLSEGKNQIAPAKIIDHFGLKVGVVGVTTPSLASIQDAGLVSVFPKDQEDMKALAKIVQKQVDRLSEKGIQHIVVLAHLQNLNFEIEMAKYLKDVDLIIGGGSDSILAKDTTQLRAEDKDLVFGEYPLWVENEDCQNIAIVNTDGQYRYLGRIQLHFDEYGELLLKTQHDSLTDVYATDDAGVERFPKAKVNPTIHLMIEDMKKLILTKDMNVLGRTTEYLDGRKQLVRTQRTNLGTLTAQANLYYAKSLGHLVDVSIKNAGGIRASIGSIEALPGQTVVTPLPPRATSYKPEGAITQLDLESSLAFNNKLVLVTLTAKQIKAVLDESSKYYPKAHGGFSQTYGVDYQVLESGGVQQLVIKNKVYYRDGKWLASMDDSFRVVTLDYLVKGGNDYPIDDFIQADPQSTDLVFLYKENDYSGTSSFAETGTEQDAMAEFLLSR